jgi:hypothetical protein
MGIRAEVFAEVGGFDESLTAAEDLDLSWRVQLAGHRLVGAPSAVVHVRKRGGVRDAVRQARAKGAGSRVVAHRFALVRDAYAQADSHARAAAAADDGASATATEPKPEPTPAPPPAPGGGIPPADRLARIPAKVLEILRSPSHATPYLAALAYRRGYRRAGVDGIAQLAPPHPLPPPV